MAQPAGSGQEDIAFTMAELLKQQAAAAQQREDRLAAMIAQLLERETRTNGDTNTGRRHSRGDADGIDGRSKTRDCHRRYFRAETMRRSKPP